MSKRTRAFLLLGAHVGAKLAQMRAHRHPWDCACRSCRNLWLAIPVSLVLLAL